MFRYVISTEVNLKKWDKALLNSNASTFFQRSEYLTAESHEKFFPVFISIYDQEEKICGQLGMMIIKSATVYSISWYRKFSNIISKFGTRGTWVNAPIIHSKNKIERLEILRTIISAIEEVGEKYNLALIDGYSSPLDMDLDEEYFNEFKKHQYTIKNFVTFVADLNQSLEELWKNVKKNAKNDITKAKRKNIVIKEVNTYEELVDYLKLARKWIKTKGAEVMDPVTRAERDWNYCKKGLEKFFVAYQDSELISGLRTVNFNGIVYTHEVLNSYSKASSLGGPLLTWYAVEWSKKNNNRIYDFSGVELTSNSDESYEISEKWKSLANYKRKWGGKELPYYHFLKTRKKISYKIFKIFMKPDLIYRIIKKKKFHRPKKE